MEAISLKAEEIFSLGGFPITNSLFLTLIVSIVLISFSLIFSKKIKLVPGKFQSAIEMGVEWFLDVMHTTLGSMEKAERYFPLIATIFIFILTSNLLGLFPGVGSLFIERNLHEVSLLRAPAADLNFTMAYAIVSVIVTNVFGMMAIGTFKHLSKFFNVTNPIKFFIGILEIVSEVAKIISLSFRLFGNVFAGEVLLMIVFSLAPYIVPLPFLFLELFVGLIQAFLFAMLTLVSISLHTATEEH